MAKRNKIRAKGLKKIHSKQIWRLFTMEAFLFSLTFILGIAAAFEINEVSKVQRIEVPQISLLKFVFYFLLATFFIFLLIRFVKFKKPKRIIFKIIFSLAVFLGGGLLLSVWMPVSLAFILIIALIFRWFTKPSILIQDFLIILGIAGTGGFLGLSLDPQMVAILLVIFSIYDFIAVYKTKHMVKMAKEMIESKAILGLVIPPNFFSLQEGLEKIKPGGEFLVLGGGDVIFPLLLSVSLIPYGIINSLIVALFSLIGLFVSFWFFISQETRQPIPALPPIALFSIIGYLLTQIF